MGRKLKTTNYGKTTIDAFLNLRQLKRIMTGEINGEVVTVFGRRVRLETYDETDPEFRSSER